MSTLYPICYCTTSETRILQTAGLGSNCVRVREILLYYCSLTMEARSPWAQTDWGEEGAIIQDNNVNTYIILTVWHI